MNNYCYHDIEVIIIIVSKDNNRLSETLVKCSLVSIESKTFATEGVVE